MPDNSELQKLKDELYSVAAHLAIIEKTNSDLTNEKNAFSDKIKNLELFAEENKNYINNTLLKIKDEVNIYKYDLEKYKTSIEEKDKIIEEHIKQFENLKQNKPALIKT